MSSTIRETHEIRIKYLPCTEMTGNPLAEIRFLPFYQQVGVLINTTAEVVEPSRDWPATRSKWQDRVRDKPARKNCVIDEGRLHTMPEWI